MARFFFSFVLTMASIQVLSQSQMIMEALKQLPPEKVYSLDRETIDSLLLGKTYYPSDNDSNSIMAFNYGGSLLIDDYIYISLSFETRQRASGMIEIRKFTTSSGDQLIIVSNTGGIRQINYQQNDLSFFKYSDNKKLSYYKKKIIPEVESTLFMKPGIPESIKKVIINNSNLSLDFSKEQVTMSLNSPYLLDHTEARKWLKGDYIELKWTGDEFIINYTGFSDL